MNLFCWKTWHRTCFRSYNSVLPSCLKYGPEKSLSRETCLNLELKNKKPVFQSVFCKTVAEASCSANLPLSPFWKSGGQLFGANSRILVVKSQIFVGFFFRPAVRQRCVEESTSVECWSEKNSGFLLSGRKLTACAGCSSRISSSNYLGMECDQTTCPKVRMKKPLKKQFRLCFDGSILPSVRSRALGWRFGTFLSSRRSSS